MKTFAIALTLLSTAAMAQPFATKIQESTCEVIAKSDSVLGTAAGGVAGGVAGRVISKGLFGRKASGWGALAGAVGGAIIGNNMASNKTYSCIVGYRDAKSKLVYSQVVGKERRIGEAITVFQSENGQIIVQ